MKRFLLILLLLIGINCSAQTVTLPSQTGVVRDVEYVDINENDLQTKQIVTVEIKSGHLKGTERTIDNMITGNPAYDINLKKGDKVILHMEQKSDEIVNSDDVDVYIADLKRDNQIYIFAGLFFALLLLVGRKKGLTGILSILATVSLIFFVMIPCVFAGINPIFISTIVCIMSTIITIYLVGGLNHKSTSAVIGTSASLIFAGILSAIAIFFAHLTGFAGEETMFLYSSRPELDFTGILAASMMIAALGALMDTSISIASTINEIYETDSSLSIRQLFESGMNVGKDIIGTMSNTLILVYLGSSLPLVMLANNIDINKFLNLNQVATEILSALTGSIAILVCVPITAIITSVMIKKAKAN